jgi:signal transduction histidine kinase
MSIRWQSLKVRYAIIASFFIAVILLVNAFVLIWLKYKEFEKDIDQRAFSFANLAVKPISDGYDTYYYSGYFKFRELMNKLISYEPDLIKILLVDVNGRILFDSDNLKRSDFIPRPGREAERLKDEYYLNAIRKLEITNRHVPLSKDDKVLEIVSPHIEEWGRHKYSVIMRFSYDAVKPQVRLLIYQIAGLTFLSMLGTSFIAWILADKITLPVVALTKRARVMSSVSPGEIRVEESENEIKLLNDAFNAMSAHIHENIQKLEMNNVKLAALNEELKELDRMKSDLLANVSHELRTPLTSIKGYIEYILEGKLGPVTPKQEKGLGVVRRNLERLAKLINALLDYSVMDAERMVLSMKPFSLQTLVRQIIATLASELEKRALEFKTDIPENLPLVMGDKDKLYQVLENLTINAIKFTEEGGAITVSAFPFELEERHWIELHVSDTGVGIPKAELDRIFDRFYQVDATSKRKYGGIGLGLAIARSIVEGHNGTITAQSEEGKGTTFIIRLPAVYEIAEKDQQLVEQKSIF